MRISRLVLSGAAVGTIVGTGRADLNDTHVFNPEWPPHARFHGAAAWGTVTAAQALGLWLIWRPAASAAEQELAVRTATMLTAVAWLPFFPAEATPGTAVEDHPGHLPRPIGIPVNLFQAGVVPAIAALGYLLHRRGL